MSDLGPAVARRSRTARVAQDAPRVELHRREADGAWSAAILPRPDDVLALRSISCELPLAAVYRRVRLEPPA